ncbi:MAG: hypothetical protein GAK29_02500 [Acinetobacter bereziniae]|uniref:Uncharacterized protein n=1 Tax=Acinetobacter bereziniae TaxID=106648 RepID=A0A833PET2_ACIBZ|nr:MAG: hypothetical protein GAK29_02500 [Acinetobacter bereziniae]
MMNRTVLKSLYKNKSIYFRRFSEKKFTVICVVEGLLQIQN